MMRHTAGNKAEHFSTVEFFPTWLVTFRESDLKLSGYSGIHASCMKYDGIPLKELMSIYAVLRISVLNGHTVGIWRFVRVSRVLVLELSLRLAWIRWTDYVILQSRSSFLRFFIKNSSRAILYCVVWNYYIYYNDRNVVYYIIVLCHHYCNLI